MGQLSRGAKPGMVARWPLHIPVIFPFVWDRHFGASVKALSQLPRREPIKAALGALSMFSTGTEFGVNLDVTQGDAALRQLYADVCQVMDLDPKRVRPYQPRLSIGRFESEKEAVAVKTDAEEKLAVQGPFVFDVPELTIMSRQREGPFENNWIIPLDGSEPKLVRAARAQPNDTLYVGNLPFSATEEDLRQLFPAASRVKLVSNAEGRSAGFAFVSFKSEADAQDTLAACEAEEVTLDGRTLRINLKEKRERSERSNRD